MKYLVAIIVSALVVGGVLSVGVYFILGETPGYFFAKFIAAPVGLVVSGIGFVAYDTVWPKKRDQ